MNTLQCLLHSTRCMSASRKGVAAKLDKAQKLVFVQFSDHDQCTIIGAILARFSPRCCRDGFEPHLVSSGEDCGMHCLQDVHRTAKVMLRRKWDFMILAKLSKRLPQTPAEKTDISNCPSQHT